MINWLSMVQAFGIQPGHGIAGSESPVGLLHRNVPGRHEKKMTDLSVSADASVIVSVVSQVCAFAYCDILICF
jgi:hypothetical protein